jgi:hypothetical protein
LRSKLSAAGAAGTTIFVADTVSPGNCGGG